MSLMETRAIELAKDLSKRSSIKIKVGAVVYNKREIISWGWNNPGDGTGDHAEHMAIRRYVSRSILYPDLPLYICVYSSRKGKTITSRPCKKCESLLRRFNFAGSTYWRKEEIDGRFVVYLVSEEYGRI